ncbi:hypothetical protein [Cyclobacterium plantarum]|uniref:hypothetical protein n=1 Tax=Cyclobacterium plantarum TaxID=2716263 RepID=UPI003F724EDF
MWTELCICRYRDGHIQATGRDLKGRNQYIYHSKWERQRQEEKFAGMQEFAGAIMCILYFCKRLNQKKFH